MGAPSGTVTFLFTDIEGSTSLWEAAPEAMATALERHDAVLRSAVDDHGGYVFSTAGDGLAAAFGRAGDAVAVAVAAQKALVSERWPQGVELRVRMGLHTGEAEERDGDYFGSPVNRAARLMAAAAGGQIVVSEATAAVLGSMAGVELIDLGFHRLRGLMEPSRVYGIKAEGLDWLDAPLATAEPRGGNLPRPLTEWFGPEKQLSEMVAQLRHRRLLTLTGPGGIGKTRLAVEAGWLAARDFSDGVWMVGLGALVDPEAVHAAVAATLGATVQEGFSPLEAVVDWLEGRRLLLVVDNCEHVLGPVAGLVTAVMDACPATTVLATSREPLGVPGERVTAVPSLATADATELFYDRAGGAGSSPTVLGEDRSVVAAICERLDGIPLAIELAAARTRSLTPADLLGRLSDRFRVLRGSMFGGTERHQTLRATVAWSYRLLDADEQLCFDRLAVFAGGFDLPAAEAVCSGEGIDADDVIDILAGLVDKSLVVAERAHAATRYRLLETLRQYAEERLDERDQTEDVRRRHLLHYLTVADEAHRLYATERWSDARMVTDEEWDNLRVAHATAMDSGDLDSAEVLVQHTFRHAYSELLVEWLDWAQRSIALAESLRRPHPATYAYAGAVAFMTGDYARAVDYGRRGIAAADEPHAPATALCWAVVAMTHLYAGQVDETLDATRQLEQVRIEALDPLDAVYKPDILALISVVLEPTAAQRHIAALAELADRSRSPWISMLHAYAAGVARLAARPPDWTTALDLCRRGLDIARSSGGGAVHVANGLEYVTFASPGLSVTDADLACVEAIDYGYQRRTWAVLWTVMGYTAGHLLRRGDAHLAATVVGYLQANQPGILPLCAFLPEGTLDHLADAGYSEAKALGAKLQRTELITAVLSTLSRPPRQPATDSHPTIPGTDPRQGRLTTHP